MNKKNLIYIGALLIVTVIVSVTYFSYAFFVHKDEQHGKLNIVTGTLDYSIKGEGVSNNKLTLAAGEEKELILAVKSLNEINSLYELYYKNNANFVVGYFDSNDSAIGTINANSTKKIKIAIQNISASTQEIELGVQGGFVGQPNTLDSAKTSINLLYETTNDVLAKFNGSNLEEAILCDRIDGNTPLYFNCEVKNTLENAFASRDRSAVIMTNDINMSTANSITASKNLLLNLNGHKIISSLANMFYVRGGYLHIVGDGMIYSNVSSASENGAIKMWDSDNSTLIIDGNICNSTNPDEYESGLLIASNLLNSIAGLIKTADTNATIQINGGCYYSQEKMGVQILGNTIANIKNAKVVSKSNAIKVESNSIANITGGSYVSDDSTSICNNGIITVDGSAYVEGKYGIGCHHSNSSITTINNGNIVGKSNDAISLADGYTSQVIMNNGSINANTFGIHVGTLSSANINGGSITSDNGIAVYNKGSGTVNINQANTPIYIASFCKDDVYSAVGIFNLSTGTININGETADLCNGNINSNTKGICLYSNFRTVLNYTNATGTININGASISNVSSNAVSSYIGKINLKNSIVTSDDTAIGIVKGSTTTTTENAKIYVCNSTVNGKNYDLSAATDESVGYIYYNSATTLSNNSIADNNNPKHIVLDSSITCAP